MNRLLQHGARFHSRKAAFASFENDDWQITPDWRADRQALRIALAFQERLGVEAGETVAVALPLGLTWILIERAVWSLSAMTLGVDPEAGLRQISLAFTDTKPAVLVVREESWLKTLIAFAPLPDSVRQVVVLRAQQTTDLPSLSNLIELASVRDTPELATAWRSRARSTPPEAIATIENGRAWTHRELVAAVSQLAAEMPPQQGSIRIVAETTPALALRLVAHSSFADGWSCAGFCDPALSERAAARLQTSKQFVRLSQVEPMLAQETVE